MRAITTASVIFLMGLVFATASFAGDRILLGEDAAISNCSRADNQVGLVDIYVGHSTVTGTTASQFQVATPACWIGATFLSFTQAPGMSATGNPTSDLIVSYGGCMTGQFLVGTLRYFSMGQASACCPVWVSKAPSAPLDGAVSLDCAMVPKIATVTVPLILNPDLGCLCINPVKATTWGGVKALYQ